MDLVWIMAHSALARAWEGHADIRRRVQRLELATCSGSACKISLHEVDALGPAVTRHTLCRNKPLLLEASALLGLRVSIAVCQTHVTALYQLMQVNCPGSLDSKYER